MNVFDVLSKVSGIPENEVMGIYETVKANQLKLSECKLHDFSIDVVPHTNINKSWKCTKCGGKVNASAKLWYETGMQQSSDRIKVLEALLSIYLKYSSDCYEDRIMYLDDWKEWAENQKELPPEFIKIVEENFWELLV